MNQSILLIFLKAKLSKQINQENELKLTTLNIRRGKDINVKEDFIFKLDKKQRRYSIVNKTLIHKNGESRYEKNSRNNLRCMYTLEIIPPDVTPIGIPIQKKIVGKEIIFHCIDVFGSFNAAYSELLRRRDSVKDKIWYKNSEKYLKEIFSEHYPKEKLLPLPDQRLLKIFNGDLSIEEFNKSVKKYKNAVNKYICLPMIQQLQFDDFQA